MWRSTVFPENENSDQSISEDDDLDGDLPEDHVSLGIPAEEKGKVQILSQFDMLRDANEARHERNQTSLLQKRRADIWEEDDVEFPFFANKSESTYVPLGASACNSDEEILSDDEGKDTDELKNHMMPVSHSHNTTSMAELLVNIQNEHGFSEGSTVKYNKRKSISKQLSIKRNVLSIGHRYIKDDPDTDTDYLCSHSSEEDECQHKHQIQGVSVLEPKQKTIADQFHEALGANEEGHMYPVSRHTGFGLFGKLQNVMQREKERDSYFLNKLQKEDEANCFDVKILTKSLEGKLTVCSCSSIENDKGSTRKNLTIIFSSRICSEVELDIGITVRIHSPWKEVNVMGKEESTILSTYFSQI